ncbi:MAG: flagellar motor protein MotB [Myxococcota bacterium]|nr:flagellar motor protein MotB [Myxococcota bacterium]
MSTIPPREAPTVHDAPHEERYTLGDGPVRELPEKPEKVRVVEKRGGIVPWMLLAIVVGAVIAGVLYVGLPMQARLRDLEAEHAKTLDELTTMRNIVDILKSDRDNSEAERARLSSVLSQKQAELDAVSRAQEELSKKLQAEIKKGEVLVSAINGQLTVDVSDKILFDVGVAELNERGKEVLKSVGETLIKLDDKVLQVGGHTDSLPITGKLTETFASNWELSAARATNVVRFLQDEVKVPGERLVAAGFSQYRPASSNASAAGRHKNRRIEIALIPTPGKRN